MKWKKGGMVFGWKVPNSWWHSHTMAPSAIYWQGKVRIFFGAWDERGISRITYLDVDPYNPQCVLYVKEKAPILDIGDDGMFDENGVFPAHAIVLDGRIYLYYTGFQKGHKILHYNFGGLAVSDDGEIFTRVSRSPVLDRQDEGLLVRAGQSVLKEGKLFRTVYSVGSRFVFVGGKERPSYDICYQESESDRDFGKEGRVIVACDHAIEHGLGRPQIIKIGFKFFVFYTRRMIDMKYFIGCAESSDCIDWFKVDDIFTDLKHSENDFDSEMIYFPSVIYIPDTNKYLLFYCGNEFGKTGIGYAELIEY